MDKFYFDKNGDAINLCEIKQIVRYAGCTDAERPVTIEFKGGQSIQASDEYARKIVSALRKSIKEDSAVVDK